MTCARAGCGGVAAFRVGFSIPALGDQGGAGREIEAEVGIAVCAECKPKVELEGVAKLFSDEGREQIAAAIRATGRAAPDFDRARITFTSIGVEA